MSITKAYRRKRIKMRIRKVVKGTTERPRLVVFRSNKEIYAQIVDDSTGKTLLSASSRTKEFADVKGTKTDIAKSVGKMISEKAVASGIQQVVFDRNGFLYHGRVKSLAEAAREAGLKF